MRKIKKGKAIKNGKVIKRTKKIEDIRFKDIKMLLQSSFTVDEADEVLTDIVGLRTAREKIAFLQGMYRVSMVDRRPSDTDEFAYKLMLDAILFH